MTETNLSIPEENKQIGKITHYFSNIEVAVIALTDILKTGEKIRIVGGEETDFIQTVGSMEVEHQKVTEAKVNDAVGLKVDEKVRDGYKVYRV